MSTILDYSILSKIVHTTMFTALAWQNLFSHFAHCEKLREEAADWMLELSVSITSKEAFLLFKMIRKGTDRRPVLQ